MDSLSAAIDAIPNTGPLAVAFSGGVDSSALLHALVQRRDRLARDAHAQPLVVHALHVHHGLQPAADAFVAHVEQRCAAWRVPLRVLRIDARNGPGESPEAAARDARYAALVEGARAQSCTRVLVAQHADDQAETVMLALSRGAGLPGLAAMPAQFMRQGLLFERPLLALTRAQLAGWLQAQGEKAIEDPTNGDAQRTRNRLRAGAMAALQRDFPGFQARFARSARHAAEAAGLLAELAELDLAQTGCPPRIEALQALSRERQANVVRHWLLRHHTTQASSAQLQALLEQVQACRSRGHHIDLHVGAGHVRRAGAALAYEPPIPPSRPV